MTSASGGEAETGAGDATRKIAFRRPDEAPLQGPPRIVAAFAFVALLCSLLWMYFHRVGLNPIGFFCDEAEIGVRTWQLIHGTLPEGMPRLPIFYNHFDTIHLGALPLYTTAPFEMLYGPTEWSVRMASVFWSTVATIALLGLSHVLRLRNGWVGVMAFALSPTAIHIARITFGHAGSLAAISLGLLVYAVARERGSLLLMIPAGALLGLSVYGYAAWYIATPLLMIGLAIGELGSNGLHPRAWRRWRPFAVAAVTCLAVWIPVVHRFLTNEAFADRFRSKEMSSGVDTGWSVDRIRSMLDEYPKYFSFDFLVRLGDTGTVTRHTVPGAGILSWTVILLVAIGIVAVVRQRRGTAKVIGVMAIAVTVMMPFPDLPTTNAGSAPYAFSVYSMLIGVPILCAFAVGMLSHWIGGVVTTSLRQAIVPVVLTALILASAWSFYRGPYANYPNVSADYWGWQYGPGAAIDAFLADNNRHDHYYLDSDYNGAWVFPEFYLLEHPEMVGKITLGAPHEHVPTMDRVMYAVKPNRWEQFVEPHAPMRRYAKLEGVIPYPDGTPALLLISISLQNPPNPINNW